jgi:hypothetical protein
MGESWIYICTLELDPCHRKKKVASGTWRVWLGCGFDVGLRLRLHFFVAYRKICEIVELFENGSKLHTGINKCTKRRSRYKIQGVPILLYLYSESIRGWSDLSCHLESFSKVWCSWPATITHLISDPPCIPCAHISCISHSILQPYTWQGSARFLRFMSRYASCPMRRL